MASQKTTRKDQHAGGGAPASFLYRSGRRGWRLVGRAKGASGSDAPDATRSRSNTQLSPNASLRETDLGSKYGLSPSDTALFPFLSDS